MNCNDASEQLDELLQERLPASQRLRLETHLTECSACRHREQELRELQLAVADLPRELQPPRDLWPGIEQALLRAGGTPRQETSRGEDRSARAGGAWWTRWELLAAAATLLIVLSSGLTAMLLRPTGSTGPATVSTQATATGAAWNEFQAAEAEYQRLGAELQTALDAKRGELSPETVRVVDDNLRLIDEAIREARGALQQDPANAGLTTKITGIYRKRVSFLREMNRL